ncbi:MbeD/MobD family mobilization/exclusion protein, partial [Enterobacter hormaechei]
MTFHSPSPKSALEQLQQDYSQRLDEWESAFAEWR